MRTHIPPPLFLPLSLPLCLFHPSHYTAGPRPLDLYMRAVPLRLVMGLIFAVIVWWTTVVAKATEGEFPMYYFIVVISVFIIHQVE